MSAKTKILNISLGLFFLAAAYTAFVPGSGIFGVRKRVIMDQFTYHEAQVSRIREDLRFDPLDKEYFSIITPQGEDRIYEGSITSDEGPVYQLRSARAILTDKIKRLLEK